MRTSALLLTLGTLLLHPSSALPAPALIQEDLLTSVLSDINHAVADLDGDASAILSALARATPTTHPTDLAQAQASLASIYGAAPTNLYENVAAQIVAGLGPAALPTIFADPTSGDDSVVNDNAAPRSSIYPRAGAEDPEYSIDEATLRAAIHVPAGFGSKNSTPVLMVPGTGSYGGSTFGPNLRKLLAPDHDIAWLNVPSALLADAQQNAEFVVYALHYLASLSNNNNNNNKQLALISWSQGGLDAQWAFTFFPSTRALVQDFIPLSPDFAGTVLANAICLAAPNASTGLAPCAPSVIQQDATSYFIAALRAQGGDKALVPTTTVYSAFFDEIVEPQQGGAASAFLASGTDSSAEAEASNNEVQSTCAGHDLAAGYFGHAGVLSHPLSYALVLDALAHEGPGRAERLDLDVACAGVAAQGLGLDDVLGTEALIPLGLALILAFPGKSGVEMGLRAYAA